MSTELAISVEDDSEFDSLHEWLRDLSGVRVDAVGRAPRNGEQGAGWDVLIAACGSGGAATLALSALRTWIESRVTTVKVKVDGSAEVEMRSSNVKETMPHLIEMVRAVRPDDATTDDTTTAD